MKNMKLERMRQAMKSAYLMRMAIKGEAIIAKLPEPVMSAGVRAINSGLGVASRIPHHLFRVDKPEIDRRRAKRWHRKQAALARARGDVSFALEVNRENE